MPYRPEIDGLRAIAVLAVVAYHFSRRFLPGGYLGVDVFFVLSGFLITSIIWREIAAGDFSLARFYLRRIRRILPALSAMLGVASTAALLFLLPADLLGFAKSLLATLGFAANIYFWRDTNYFSTAAAEKPLLHLWSLGIEEQYYLLFPLILLLLARRSWALPGIFALGIVSFALDSLAFKVDGALPAFYLLPTRAWELAAGALAALIPPAASVIIAYGGALLLAVGIAAPLHFPFLPDSLPVVAGTTLLVWGAGGKHPVGRLLSGNVPVFLGLISYSLYLWHWPILVFCKYFLVRDLSAGENWLAFLSILVLATLSWRFVERPYRESTISAKTVLLATLAVAILASSFAGAILYRKGFPERFAPAAAKMIEAFGTNYRCPVQGYLYFSGSRACELALPSRNPEDADVVLFGNSHALMYAPLVREFLQSKSLSGLLVSENACLPTFGANISPSCRELSDRNLDAIARLKRARVVLIGTTWDEFVAGGAGKANEVFLAALDKTIDRLIAAGKKVVLIGPIATPGWEVASVASRSLAFGRPIEHPLYCTLEEFRARYSAVIGHFERRRDIVFVRPDLAQCKSGRCDYVVDGRSLFADSHHLAIEGLGVFRPAFAEPIKKVLASH